MKKISFVLAALLTSSLTTVSAQATTIGNSCPVVSIPTAVPENNIYTMMLTGLGLVGFAANRRHT